MFLVGQRLARVIRQVLAPQRVGMIVHGFGVPHAHLVLVPLQQASDITAAQFAVIEGDRIVFRWETVPITPREELETLADLLRREAVRSEPAPEKPTDPRQHSRFL